MTTENAVRLNTSMLFWVGGALIVGGMISLLHEGSSESSDEGDVSMLQNDHVRQSALEKSLYLDMKGNRIQLGVVIRF